MIDLFWPGLAISGPLISAAATWAWQQRSQRRPIAELAESRARYAELLRRQHAQAELFHALFEAAPECIKLQAADGRVQRMNAAGLALLETSQPSRIVGKSVYSVIAPEYHPAYRRLTEQVFDGGTAFMEFELITFEGRRRWLETHAVPMRGEDGRVAGLLAITRDIDERVRMTRRLEEQHNHLHTIIESEPECVKLHSPDGTIVEINPAGIALLRAERPQQVIGHSVYEFVTAGYHAAYRELSAQVFAGERASMEFELATLDGQRRWVETHAAPLRDAAGEVGALLAITRDIDERKQQEQKLRNHRNELAHLCRLGTLGELATGLAHELNQPLCALSSYAQSALLMNNRPYARDSDKISGILLKIVAEADRAGGIIKRLRDLVQRRPPQPQAHSLAELIHEALDIVEPERRRRGFHIAVDLQQDLPLVRVDRIQTEQVLVNLLCNALQAEHSAPRCTQHIDIRAHACDGRVHIEIRDHADGIPQHRRPHLFSPFFTTKPKGIGMGLALSRSIAEAHGGTLGYRAADPGSLFHLELPLPGEHD